jgi:chromatin remodeling complex protein RSC6
MDVVSAGSLPAGPVEEDTPETLNARAVAHIEIIRSELSLLTAVVKLLKRASKRSERGTRRKRTADADAGDVPKKPSGFSRPSDLSPELCAFLGVPSGTPMPRTVVTRMMCEYIKQNELGLATNKRCVDFTKPAAANLRRLLDPEPGATVTYFNLQRYLKRHIRRAEGETSTATCSETVQPGSVAVSSATAEVAAAAPGPRKKQKKETAAA